MTDLFEPLDIFEESEPQTEGIQTDEPDATFIKKPRRDRNAAAYEKKVKNLLNAGMRLTIQNPATIPDAAALIMYGGELSRTMGDLAAKDPWVRRSIDFISGGADNPYLAVIAAATPLVLQLLRNHEPVAEMPVRRIRIPFTKRELRIKFRIKLGKLRNLSNDPQQFTAHVLSNADVQAELQRQGILIGEQQSSNGRTK